MFLSIKIAQTAPTSRDGYGWQSLEGGRALCAWVVDAPDDARTDTADTVNRAVKAFFTAEMDTERTVANVASEQEARIILADLVTNVSDSLLNAAAHWQAPMHAAAIFVLVTRHGMHFVTVGDCSALIFLSEPDAIYRLSGSTRLDSTMRLDLLPALCRHPEHYKQAEYLGGTRLLVHPSDVVLLPLRSTPRLILMSDGPERQVCASDLIVKLRDADLTRPDTRQEIEAFLTREAPVDDLTLLAFEARLTEVETLPEAPSVPPAELPESPVETLALIPSEPPPAAEPVVAVGKVIAPVLPPLAALTLSLLLLTLAVLLLIWKLLLATGTL